MNANYPHDLLSETEVRKLPAAERRTYVPLPARDVEQVAAMTAEQRAAWLVEHPADALRLERAAEKRARRSGVPPA